MKNIVAVDNVVVSAVAIIAILIVLLVTFRSLTLPLVLLLTIESGIWINLSIPYFMGESVNFIGYLVINTVQLGATIDYGILLTTHYLRHRRRVPARKAAPALGETFPSLLVSAGIWLLRASRWDSRPACRRCPAWASCSPAGAAR
ncbi:MAG: MMPL family transporter [Eggerthellaceae bacterium]